MTAVQLADAANTYDHALELVARAGYALALRDGDEVGYRAVGAAGVVEAGDPLRLLARVVLGAGEGAVLARLAADYAISRDGDGDWRATRPDVVLIARDPLRLFALAQLLAAFGPAWASHAVPHHLRALYR